MDAVDSLAKLRQHGEEPGEAAQDRPDWLLTLNAFSGVRLGTYPTNETHSPSCFCRLMSATSSSVFVTLHLQLRSPHPIHNERHQNAVGRRLAIVLLASSDCFFAWLLRLSLPHSILHRLLTMTHDHY